MTVEPVYHDEFGDYDIETGSYTSLNWKSAKSRDSWADHIRGMAKAKEVAEWRSVIDDETDRKAAIIHINNHNREEWLERVSEYGLSYRPIRYSEPYGGFAHKFSPTTEDDPNRITYSVVAENDDIADKMEEAENEMQGAERHNIVGELLGFPDCCREFFMDDWVEGGIRDPMYEISCNTPSSEPIGGNQNHILVKNPNAGTCVMWRYWGLSFITHMPCSWECEESIDVGRERYRIMNENGYGEEADLMFEWIQHPFTWSAYHGQVNVQNPHVTSKANSSCYLDEKKVVWEREFEPLSH